MYELGLEIKKINNKIARKVQNLSSIALADQLTGSNGIILRYIQDHADVNISQKDIETNFSITRSTASKVLSLMEKKELISRYVDEFDARSKRIMLTAKGEEIANGVKQELQDFEKSLKKGFSEAELNLMYQFFQRIKENIKHTGNMST